MIDINKTTVNELIEIFSKIHALLLQENENNWIRGINSIRQRLSQIENGTENSQMVFKDIAASYRSMNSGQGSFSDYMIWRQDMDEMQKLNQEFQLLVNKAWQILDL